MTSRASWLKANYSASASESEWCTRTKQRWPLPPLAGGRGLDAGRPFHADANLFARPARVTVLHFLLL